MREACTRSAGGPIYNQAVRGPAVCPLSLVHSSVSEFSIGGDKSKEKCVCKCNPVFFPGGKTLCLETCSLCGLVASLWEEKHSCPQKCEVCGGR